MHSEAEYRFYSELRRRTDATIINDENHFDSFKIGEKQIAFNDGQIRILYNGELETAYPIQEFSKSSNATFRKIYNNI